VTSYNTETYLLSFAWGIVKPFVIPEDPDVDMEGESSIPENRPPYMTTSIGKMEAIADETIEYSFPLIKDDEGDPFYTELLLIDGGQNISALPSWVVFLNSSVLFSPS